MYKSYRSAPVSRLPEDTLLAIFEELTVRLFSDVSSVHSTLIEQSQWNGVRLSHVCRYWRHIILHYPKLWSCITQFRRKDALEVFLSRSSDAPLTVLYLQLSSIRPCKTELLEIVLSHLPRIRILNIQSVLFNRAVKQDWMAVGSMLKRPAPSMEQTHISITHKDPLDIQLWNSIYWEDMYDGHAPKLLSLSVDLGLLDKKGFFSIANGLSCLRLENTPRDQKKILRILDILGIFERCPGLKEFRLKAVLSSEVDPTIDESRIVKLPLLESFSISEAEFAACQKLLALIDFPVTALWSVACDEYPINLSTPSYFAPGLGRSLNDTEFYILEIETKALLSFYLIRFTAFLDGARSSYKLDLKINREHEISTSIRMEELLRVFRQTFRVRSANILLSLRCDIFTDTPAVSEDHWRDFLDMIPDAKSLVTKFTRYSECAQTIQNLLAAMMTASTDERNRLPHLKILTMGFCNTPDGFQHPPEDPFELAHQLGRCIMKRCENGLTLTKLLVAIDDQSFYRKNVFHTAVLNMFVKELIWKPYSVMRNGMSFRC